MSLQRTLKSGFEFLLADSALEAVLYVVAHLEDDPLFNAGTGSVLQQDGQVRMSASVMDGVHRRFAAVSNIERVRNPVVVASALLGNQDRILSGKEAVRFARSLGHRSWDPIIPERLRQWKKLKPPSYGTVGAVAVDLNGGLAAATSSGGKLAAQAGRVSDSAMPSGNYATPTAAISCTGLGEDTVDEAVAVRIAEKVQTRATLEKAFSSIFEQLKRGKRQLAAIGVDHSGKLAWASTLPCLYAVGQTPHRRIKTF